MIRLITRKNLQSYLFVIFVYFILFSIFGEGRWILFIVSVVFAVVFVLALEFIWQLLTPTDDIKRKKK